MEAEAEQNFLAIKEKIEARSKKDERYNSKDFIEENKLTMQLD